MAFVGKCVREAGFRGSNLQYLLLKNSHALNFQLTSLFILSEFY